MGLFSRKDSAAPRKPPGKPRPSVSSEAQAAELRVRARRRLAGAVALVLAAVVVLPMLLDSEPIPVSNNIAIRIPDRNAPFQPALTDSATNGIAPATGLVTQTPGASVTSPGSETSSGTVTPAAAPAAVAAPPAAPVAAVAPTAKPEPKPEQKTKPEPKTEAKSDAAKSSQTNSNRSDDGARALALLEGRPTESNTANNAAANKQPTKGNFVVQALSLDAATDAQAQRDKLSASGVSNSFVDGPVVVNGMKKYRVRVGPFPSREAAQAAQTRLRTLGFGGAFITAQ